MSVETEGYVRRRSGLLVPGRAIPGDEDYQGTYGESAREFLKTMQAAGFNILHDLPANPPDEKFNCPYSAESAFALDMQRIDLEQLVEIRDLTRDELNAYRKDVRSGDRGTDIRGVKGKLVHDAAHRFANEASPERKSEFQSWCNTESEWLDSYAAFEILKEVPGNAGKPWQQWEFGKDYSPERVADLKQGMEQQFTAVCYEQWIAEQQATQYRDKAKELGIELWGDVPFYVGPAEVWAHRELFNLDSEGNQLSQGGVPPGNSSEPWQVWGNATYKVSGDDPETTNKVVDWWVKRLERSLKISGGVIRLDYFIGLAGPYLLPMHSTEKAPQGAGMGRMLMKRLVSFHGKKLPFYAEDLGCMTDEARHIRDGYGDGLDGSRVVTFELERLAREGFDESEHNPDNYPLRSVAFTSNHDTRTLAQVIEEARRKKMNGSDIWPYLHLVRHLQGKFPSEGINENMTSAELAQFKVARVIGSRALVSMVPVWDVLGAGKEGRYNIPNTTGPHNWTWRMSGEQMSYLKTRAEWLRGVNTASGRTDYASAS